MDDRVMGGVSSSQLRFDAGGFAVFEGLLSTARGGGFASVRHPDLALGGQSVQGYRMSVRSDGKHYKLSLRTDQALDAVQYQAEWCVDPGTWIEIDLPVAVFLPRFRGKVVTGTAALDPVKVCQVGLTIADRQTGSFRLDIRSIKCY